jgi:ATP-dependent helicase YprA (DUF1998 family)
LVTLSAAAVLGGSKALALRDAGESESICAVILYPMNALAEDQLGRLRELLCGVGVSFGLYVGKTREPTSDATGPRLPVGSSREDYRATVDELRTQGQGGAVHPPEERVSREEMRTPGKAPRILLTNAKQLELLASLRTLSQWDNTSSRSAAFCLADRMLSALGAMSAGSNDNIP